MWKYVLLVFVFSQYAAAMIDLQLAVINDNKALGETVESIRPSLKSTVVLPQSVLQSSQIHYAVICTWCAEEYSYAILLHSGCLLSAESKKCMVPHRVLWASAFGENGEMIVYGSTETNSMHVIDAKTGVQLTQYDLTTNLPYGGTPLTWEQRTAAAGRFCAYGNRIAAVLHLSGRTNPLPRVLLWEFEGGGRGFTHVYDTEMQGTYGIACSYSKLYALAGNTWQHLPKSAAADSTSITLWQMPYPTETVAAALWERVQLRQIDPAGIPNPVTGEEATRLVLGSIVHVCAGGRGEQNSFVHVMLSDSHVYGFGANGYGQLGDGLVRQTAAATATNDGISTLATRMRPVMVLDNTRKGNENTVTRRAEIQGPLFCGFAGAGALDKTDGNTHLIRWGRRTGAVKSAFGQTESSKFEMQTQALLRVQTLTVSTHGTQQQQGKTAETPPETIGADQASQITIGATIAVLCAIIAIIEAVYVYKNYWV